MTLKSKLEYAFRFIYMSLFLKQFSCPKHEFLVTYATDNKSALPNEPFTAELQLPGELFLVDKIKK